MDQISTSEIVKRICTENPWWSNEGSIPDVYSKFQHRAYFRLFMPLVEAKNLRRGIVLMGPRRVGKTVMIHHTIQALIEAGIEAKNIVYFSVDHPIYNGLGLEKLLTHFQNANGTDYTKENVYVFFDEIQYLRNWEVHLKTVIDSYPNIKFVASGSAAAALKLKSQESGAGRFTDFLLPPLTFYEYLDLIGKGYLVEGPITSAETKQRSFISEDITDLNDEFIDYLNFGGYPEVVFSELIRSNPGRFIKNDIIDKVLLRDLPGLYGIGDIQELNSLFTTIAFNTANEISLQELSKHSGVAKNTIKRYIEYLEAAFLIKVVHRVDHNSKRFDRANFFKIYLTNPSMRAALFSPIGADDDAIGRLAETAIFSQWFHSDVNLHYARWDKGKEKGEVDIVYLANETQKPLWVVEVKWSDRYCVKPEELRSVLSFCRRNQLDEVIVTSKSLSTIINQQGVNIKFEPSSLYCYEVGYNIINSKDSQLSKMPV